MNCYYPNFVFQDDFGTEFLSKDFIINHPDFLSRYADDPRLKKVPCGQCIACRINRSKEWSVRIMAESLYHEFNYFVTLTYDDDFLPDNYSLVKNDVRDFIKDLRAYYEYHYNHKNIRYFLSGEYGENSLRPHYHLIIFNLPIYDLSFYKSSNIGNCYYNSAILEKIWKKGFVVIGDLTNQSAAYTARYILKKQTGLRSDYYDQLNIIPEFSLMSRRPGIGYDFFKDNYEKIFKFDSVVIPSLDNPSNSIPRYYKKLMKGCDLDTLDQTKSRLEKLAKNLNLNELSGTNLSEDEYLFEKHNSFENRLKLLKKVL